MKSPTIKLSFGAKRSKLERLVGRSVTEGKTMTSHEEFLMAVEHVKGGEGRRTWSCSDGWAVTTPKRLVELEIAEELLSHIGEELRRIDETSALPDGDGVSVCVALWAKELAKQIASVLSAPNASAHGEPEAIP